MGVLLRADYLFCSWFKPLLLMTLPECMAPGMWVWSWAWLISRYHRYRVVVDIPMQLPMFRILPAGLQNGREISVVAVLFTQGVNEQQSIADTYVICHAHLLTIFTTRIINRFGDSHLQDQINFKNFQKLSQYCEKFREKFSTSGMK